MTSPPPQPLVRSADLTSFFRQEVVSARAALQVSLSEVTEFYLVQLLCDFSRHNRASQGVPGGEPLAFIYQRASSAPPAVRAPILKQLGDVALYVAGFFTDSIERSLVDVDYYVRMGCGAYQDLAALAGQQRQGDTFVQLYGQLATRFTTMVDVLNEIAERSQHSAGRDGDLLKLYDRYNRTGSERIRRLLLERGLLAAQPQAPLAYIQ